MFQIAAGQNEQVQQVTSELHTGLISQKLVDRPKSSHKREQRSTSHQNVKTSIPKVKIYGQSVINEKLHRTIEDMILSSSSEMNDISTSASSGLLQKVDFLILIKAFMLFF